MMSKGRHFSFRLIDQYFSRYVDKDFGYVCCELSAEVLCEVTQKNKQNTNKQLA